MYKITIKGEAKTDYSNLKELDGINCQDEFTEYFSGERCESFKNDVTNGYLNFKYENGKLWSVTTYDSTRKLTDEEIENLVSYTQGQWSDGIGEGFEQNACYYDEDDNEVFISPWFHGQNITTIQEEVKETVNN